MALRKREMLTAQRPFLARGSKIMRCDDCLLPKSACICDAKPQSTAKSAFLFLMYRGEYYKPTNTGRLIADVAQENFAFVWNRTQPDQALLELLNNARYQPIVIFPHQDVDEKRRISQIPEQKNRIPLFIMLDGTWREAKKMMAKSPYLNDFPVLGITPEKSSNYILREAVHQHQLCTAEVGVEVLRLAGELQSADSLETYFNHFRTRYLKGKMNQTML